MERLSAAIGYVSIRDIVGGYSEGDMPDMRSIIEMAIAKADERMYEDKQQYYMQSGEIRRR